MLKVYRLTNKQSIEEKVETIKKAIDFINDWAEKDLQDESIEWNAFGLEEFNVETKEFDEWYNEDGESIEDVMQKMEV